MIELIDGSTLDVFGFCALQEHLLTLRQGDKIGDVILISYPHKNALLCIRIQDNRNFEKVWSLCKDKKLEYTRMVIPFGGGIHSNKDFVVNFFSKGLFGNIQEAQDRWASVFIHTLYDLGIEDTELTPNSVMFEGKRVAGYVYGKIGKVDFLGGCLCFYADPIVDSMRINIKSLEIAPAKIKVSLVKIAQEILETTITEKELTKKEQKTISSASPKFKDREWVDKGVAV